MSPSSDPYEPYLRRAETLFAEGDVVQAGQIWQAILKREPQNAQARAGLYKVKAFFDARATQDGLAVPAAPVPPPVLKRERPEITELLERGCALYDAGQTAEAVKAWEQVQAMDAGNPLAEGYLKGAKRKLEAETFQTGSMLTLQAQERASQQQNRASQEPPPPQGQEAHIRLLQEGCTLYDMGQVGDALLKWEQILASDPHHALALTYANDARKELCLPPLSAGVPPAVQVVPPVPVQERAPWEEHFDVHDRVEQLVQEGIQIYDLGMTDEAIQKWQRALELDPNHENASEYLRMALRPAQAPPSQPRPAAPQPALPTPIQPQTLLAPPPTPASRPLEAGSPKRSGIPTPVDPPRALTTRATPQRDGLKVPGAVKGLNLPPWFRTPKHIALALGAGMVLGTVLYFVRDHLLELALKNAVSSAKADALKPVARQVDIASLTETPEAIRKEAEDALSEDPLLAYYRAKEWLRLDPGNAAAGQLVESAKGKMSVPPKGTLTDFDKAIKAGDLESARTLIHSLLSLLPEDPDLREKARFTELALAQLYANKEHFGEARDSLCRVRAMFPQEKAWTGRLKLLESIQTLPKNERAGWIQMLG